MLDLASFAYDQLAPPGLTVLTEHAQADAVVQDIVYDSPRGGKVTATVIIPERQPSQAGLIFGHWGQGDRTEFIAEAGVLARLGFAALCLDAPFRRPAQDAPPIGPPPAEDVQWLVDVRRGVDVLTAQFGVPAERLGYVGHSYGATLGGTLAGIEHRIRAYVLMAGWYALSELTRTSTHPVLVEERATTPPDVYDAALAAMAPLDAVHYIGQAASAAFFFQYARHDPFVEPKDGQHFYDLAPEPKQIAWYDDCDHELNAQARQDRAIWLCATLGLPPPAPDDLECLARLPPPQPLA